MWSFLILVGVAQTAQEGKNPHTGDPFPFSGEVIEQQSPAGHEVAEDVEATLDKTIEKADQQVKEIESLIQLMQAKIENRKASATKKEKVIDNAPTETAIEFFDSGVRPDFDTTWVLDTGKVNDRAEELTQPTPSVN